MARKAVLRALPPLARVFSEWTGFRPTENQRERLCGLLRELAQAHRRGEPEPFYAMREVATFFGVTVPTVAAAYARLETENLLVRRRGSMTILAAADRRTHLPLRGVVVLPIYTFVFLIDYEWRSFFVRLEEELRRLNFVADFVFYTPDEPDRPEFARRVLAHAPDILVWLVPVASQRMTLASIRDGGVRVVVVGSGPDRLPDERFRLDWESGCAAVLRGWWADGIRTVLLGWPAATAYVTPPVVPLAAQLGLRTRVFQSRGTSHERYLRELRPDPHTAVFFYGDFWFQELGLRAPLAFVDLLRRARVCVVRRLNIPPGLLTGARVDVLELDWEGLAVRVAREIHSGHALAGQPPIIVPAVWRPRVPAVRFTTSEAAPFPPTPGPAASRPDNLAGSHTRQHTRRSRR